MKHLKLLHILLMGAIFISIENASGQVIQRQDVYINDYNHEHYSAIEVLGSSDIIVMGTVFHPGDNRGRIEIMRLNSSGGQVWHKFYFSELENNEIGLDISHSSHY